LVAGVLCADEWIQQSISTKFLLRITIIPFVSIAFAFGLQIISLFINAKEQEEKRKMEIKFLGAFDGCRGKSIIRRNFLGYLIDQWDMSMSNLSEGVITIQEDYWKVCSELYGLAKNTVECTSSVSINYWYHGPEENLELLRYKEAQIRLLIKNGICVRRTFILNSLAPSADTTTFLKVANIQLHEGFCIYYTDLSSEDPSLRQLLSSDFALIDDLVLMLGRQSDINQSVFYYDFFELVSSSTYPLKHKPALDLIHNTSVLFDGGKPIPKVVFHRKRIDEFPLLFQPGYEEYRDSILPQARRLKCWYPKK
jgi:hypothetical protein